ncbi:MAG TPA: histidine phosphatase family protein [Chloroflexota bacterium]|nr:histidine phosphatase family protein [Chloroflexota bacterium]
MAGTPVRILLARHGETAFNVAGRWQGQTDSPLTERGLAQARELGRALANEPIAAVYSSDLGRAMNTAREVALPHGLAVEPEARLREINTGGFTGKDHAEIRATYPGMQEAWTSAPGRMRLPDGETLAEVQARALDFLVERMPAHLGQTVVVIAHGGICQTILATAMGLSVEDLWLKERIDNCQISRLEWTIETGLRLIELCDVRHLEEVGSLRVWRTDAV